MYRVKVRHTATGDIHNSTVFHNDFGKWSIIHRVRFGKISGLLVYTQMEQYSIPSSLVVGSRNLAPLLLCLNVYYAET